MSTDEKPLMDMAYDERVDLATFLETLTLQEWHAPSLCTKWTVKDVVAHVVSYEELSPVGLARRFAKGWVLRANEIGVEEFAPMSPQELMEFLAGAWKSAVGCTASHSRTTTHGDRRGLDARRRPRGPWHRRSAADGHGGSARSGRRTRGAGTGDPGEPRRLRIDHRFGELNHSCPTCAGRSGTLPDRCGSTDLGR
jgi:hypothetical protein